MCEDAARLRLDEAEARHHAKALEVLLAGSVRELDLLRNRVRDLEDAIALHRKSSEFWPDPAGDDDEKLWEKLGPLWT